MSKNLQNSFGSFSNKIDKYHIIIDELLEWKLQLNISYGTTELTFTLLLIWNKQYNSCIIDRLMLLMNAALANNLSEAWVAHLEIIHFSKNVNILISESMSYLFHTHYF